MFPSKAAAFGVVALYYPSTNNQTVGSTKVSFIKDIDWLDIGKVDQYDQAKADIAAGRY